MLETELSEVASAAEAVRRELGRVIVGQERAIGELLTACVAGGHVLLEGVPGLAKTLMVRCLAATLDLSYSRIQFTPDLMPADVTGVNVFDRRSMEFSFRRGPVFAEIVLADEINRAPAKTQSALLEAMQEGQVTVDGGQRPLPELFTVVATQNPLEFEGTYPLPEAQLDRFLMKIVLGYPSREDETAMLRALNGLGEKARGLHRLLEKRVDGERLRRMRRLLHGVEADETVVQYVVDLVQASRSFPSLAVGASPRAALMLLHAAKALALLRGRPFVRPDEVQEAAAPVLRHRLTLTPEAQIEGLTADRCIENLLQQVAVPR